MHPQNLKTKLSAYGKTSLKPKPRSQTRELEILTELREAHEYGLHSFSAPDQVFLTPQLKIEREKILFFDVECIELGFGINNIPYLIGMASFENEKLKITRILSNTPLKEPEALEFLEEYWKNYDAIITYNGKSFDIPLIKSRYALFEKSHPHRHQTHMDLYHVLKKIIDLDRYRLKDTERNILHFERLNDLSGEFSGQAYFEWLQHDSRDLLNQIIQHNAVDLQSMASLALILNNKIADFLSGNEEVFRQWRMYRLFSQPSHEICLKNVQWLHKKNANDFFQAGMAAKKTGRFLKAYLYFRRAYGRGKKNGLIEALVLLRKQFHRHDLAIKLAEKYLAKEEYHTQHKLLNQLRILRKIRK